MPTHHEGRQQTDLKISADWHEPFVCMLKATAIHHCDYASISTTKSLSMAWHGSTAHFAGSSKWSSCYSRGHSIHWVLESQKILDRGDDTKGTGSSYTSVEEQGYIKMMIDMHITHAKQRVLIDHNPLNTFGNLRHLRGQQRQGDRRAVVWRRTPRSLP